MINILKLIREGNPPTVKEAPEMAYESGFIPPSSLAQELDTREMPPEDAKQYRRMSLELYNNGLFKIYKQE